MYNMINFSNIESSNGSNLSGSRLVIIVTTPQAFENSASLSKVVTKEKLVQAACELILMIPNGPVDSLTLSHVRID